MITDRKNKHMTLDDRIEIQECLNKGIPFKYIAKRIGKDPTTVSKEVKLRSQFYSNSFTTATECCPNLCKPPYVCNSCNKRNHSNCKYQRCKYVAKTAQAEYEAVLVESREGIPLNKADFYKTEKIISDGVKSGQHIYHIIKANNLKVSKSTVYRHIEKGYYTISKIDLPRAVKFKPRKKHASDYVPQSAKIGRTYEDFQIFMEENPHQYYVEMDTVIGRPGGKVIMTFHFVNFDFMFALLLDNKTATEAGKKVINLKEKLSTSGFAFGDIFPVLLTDNGGEFSNVWAFENDTQGNKESSVFFCHPNAPYEKPHIENNHTLFRDIVPKGKSFDDFTQETVNLIFSDINAIKRKQFNGKSAYDLFTFTFSKELAAILGISFVEATKVIQSPKLLK